MKKWEYLKILPHFLLNILIGIWFNKKMDILLSLMLLSPFPLRYCFGMIVNIRFEIISFLAVIIVLTIKFQIITKFKRILKSISSLEYDEQKMYLKDANQAKKFIDDLMTLVDNQLRDTTLLSQFGYPIIDKQKLMNINDLNNLKNFLLEYIDKNHRRFEHLEKRIKEIEQSSKE